MCNGASGSRFEMRETEIICDAINLGGNWATCVFTVKGGNRI